MPGKRVQFDDEIWHALNLLAHDRMQDFQELADEAGRALKPQALAGISRWEDRLFIALARSRQRRMIDRRVF
jgi:hypothetical protein